jgi:hypothetical protein
MVLHQNRQEDQCVRIEEPDINPFIYNHVIFDKGAQIHDGKRAPTSTDVA